MTHQTRILTIALAVIPFLYNGPSRADEPTPELKRVETIALKGPFGGLDHLARASVH